MRVFFLTWQVQQWYFRIGAGAQGIRLLSWYLTHTGMWLLFSHGQKVVFFFTSRHQIHISEGKRGRMDNKIIHSETLLFKKESIIFLGAPSRKFCLNFIGQTWLMATCNCQSKEIVEYIVALNTTWVLEAKKHKIDID